MSPQVFMWATYQHCHAIHSFRFEAAEAGVNISSDKVGTANVRVQSCSTDCIHDIKLLRLSQPCGSLFCRSCRLLCLSSVRGWKERYTCAALFCRCCVKERHVLSFVSQQRSKMRYSNSSRVSSKTLPSCALALLGFQNSRRAGISTCRALSNEILIINTRTLIEGLHVKVLFHNSCNLRA